jgi:hypothetical protein
MTNEEAADYSDIIKLCRVLDGTTYDTEDGFIDALEDIINVDSFLRYMSVISLLDNWDAYPNTGNNFYLFYNSVEERFEWIPWDLSWGGNPHAPLFYLDGPRLVERAPMYDRVMAANRYRLKFAAYLDLLTRNWFTVEHMQAQVYRFHNMIAPYVALGDKMFYSPNALYSPSAFDNSVDGLVEFVRQRRNYVESVLRGGM